MSQDPKPRRRISKALLTAFMVIACMPCTWASDTKADLVITNARIFTVNEDRPWAKAMAIRDGELVYVGDDNWIRAHIGNENVSHRWGLLLSRSVRPVCARRQHTGTG